MMAHVVCVCVVACFPFQDHNAPPLEMIHEFCVAVDEYLKQSPENVVGVHCKAGKGRTGVMICALLMYFKLCEGADEALKYYAKRRTYDMKGVTIPSQQRYVRYWDEILRTGFRPK